MLIAYSAAQNGHNEPMNTIETMAKMTDNAAAIAPPMKRTTGGERGNDQRGLRSAETDTTAITT